MKTRLDFDRLIEQEVGINVQGIDFTIEGQLMEYDNQWIYLYPTNQNLKPVLIKISNIVTIEVEADIL